MRVCLHGGAKEIGGSCIEVVYDGVRIFLDAGLPIDHDIGEVASLPAARGLREGDPSIAGLIVSHGHPDHYGLIDEVHESVPLFLGEATQRILKQASFFTSGGTHRSATGFLVDRVPLRLGPFTVTPYLADHSAFDAYSLLVEAGGRRLFYSGDVRAHGRKSALFERLVVNPPAGVDVLLLEGTNIRPHPVRPGISERDVEDECVRVFRETEGMVLACYSAQNIDRLVTLFRASKRSRRTLVFDLYTATMARATGRATIPQADWNGVRVFIPLSQRIKVKQSREFERIAWLSEHRLYPEDLCRNAGDLVLTFRTSMTAEPGFETCLQGAHAVWSMWSGYLEEASGVKLRKWLEMKGVHLSVIHSSGHAAVEDLQRLAAAINAREIVPIHTRQAYRYAELFANVRERSAGEWWSM